MQSASPTVRSVLRTVHDLKLERLLTFHLLHPDMGSHLHESRSMFPHWKNGLFDDLIGCHLWAYLGAFQELQTQLRLKFYFPLRKHGSVGQPGPLPEVRGAPQSSNEGLFIVRICHCSGRGIML